MHIRPRHLPRTNFKLIFHNTECLHRTSINSTTTSTDTCSTQIDIVNSYKYLGVHLDEHFKWKVHTDILHKKLRKSSYALYHLSNCSPYSVLRQAYLSLAESYLRHGITAWSTATYCKSLQLTQNRLLKLLHKNLHKNQHNTHTLNQDNHYANNNAQTQQNKGNTNNINHNQRSSKSAQLCRDLQVLNIKNLYKTTIINEFYNNTQFFQQLYHEQNTRNRAQ